MRISRGRSLISSRAWTGIMGTRRSHGFLSSRRMPRAILELKF